MSTEDGGPAFPSTLEWYGQRGEVREQFCVDNHQDGMTLRDYFAGRVITGYVWNPEGWETMAKRAYAIADAMLAERKK